MDSDSHERFRRADAVLDAALELSDDERDAFVGRECADDPELRAAVHRLLAAYRQSADFLESPAAALAHHGWSSYDASKTLKITAPLSNVVHARFPNASALERFWTLQSDDGRSQIATEFASEGLKRRLTVRVLVPVLTILMRALIV